MGEINDTVCGQACLTAGLGVVGIAIKPALASGLLLALVLVAGAGRVEAQLYRPGALPGQDHLEALPHARTSTCPQGLETLPSPVPGGGELIDLKGRFRSIVVAHRRADGSLALSCTTAGSDDDGPAGAERTDR